VRILVVYVHIPGCQRLREGAEGWRGRVPGCQRLALPARRGTCRLEGSGPWLPPAGNRMRRTRRPKRRQRERFRGAVPRKRSRQEKKAGKKNHRGFTILIFWKSNMGYFWRWSFFFSSHTTVGVDKKTWMRNKI